MLTTLTKFFQGNMYHALAGIGKRKTRKQLLSEMAKEALAGVDQAKGMWGKRDWAGAATQIQKMSRLVCEGVDLAETVIGVSLPIVRKQAETVDSVIAEAETGFNDEDPSDAYKMIINSNNALSKAAQALLQTANKLRDDVQKCDNFSELDIIKSIK